MQQINNTILLEIQKKREKMIDLAQKKGLANDDTIQCSQELDKLIYQYQASFRKKRQPIDRLKIKIQRAFIWSKKTV